MTIPPNPQSLVDIVDGKKMSTKAQGLQNSICKWYSVHWRAILAEFMATTLLIALGCMSCIPIDGLPTQSPLYAPLGFGFVVSFNIQTFGHISGAHMNPAVTVASFICGGTSFTLTVAYIIAQCTGAIIGYGILVAVSPIDLVPGEICVTLPHAGHTLYQALAVEIVLTATLSLINCACWDPVNEHKQESVPIKFGLAIAGLSIAGGPLTGASMNPARSLGPVVWTGAWTAHWVYWAGPFIGGSVAAAFYKYIWLTKKDVC